MDRERSKRSKDLNHQQFRSLLGSSFRPTKAAFVLHLSQCERCRSLAARQVDPDASAQVGGYLGNLSPLERDFVLGLTHGSYMLGLIDKAFDSEDDLPPAELRSFLGSLRPDQMELIRHLLSCRGCRDTAAKTLAPRKSQSLSTGSIPATEVTA